jgi:hypothetical protein
MKFTGRSRLTGFIDRLLSHWWLQVEQFSSLSGQINDEKDESQPTTSNALVRKRGGVNDIMKGSMGIYRRPCYNSRIRISTQIRSNYTLPLFDQTDLRRSFSKT